MSKSQKKDLSSDYIIVDACAKWLQRKIPDAFCDKELMRIILFYVLHSPGQKGSYSRVNLEQYGWKNPWHKDKFKKLIDSKAHFSEETYQFVEAQKDFKELWELTGMQDNFYDLAGKEFAFFAYAGESNPHLDMLHHIRNALAHGRFTARKYNKEYYIFMEDVKEMHEQLAVNARIVLRKKTLVDWIDISRR